MERAHLRYALVLGLVLATATPVSAQPETDAPPVYKGRQVAQVMSFRGAPWLEREGRAEEENTDALIAKLGLEPGQNVADIGCGSGFYSRRMARQIAPGGTVFGVDIQPEMLRFLAELAANEGIDNIVPVQGREDEPFLPAGEIDWVLLVDVYHEFQQPEPMLAGILESLAPGGRVALVEYRLEGESARHIKLEHRMSPQQVASEWGPAGFELVELWDELPTQHVFIFRAAGDRP